MKMNNTPVWISPMENQEITDIALHLKWTKVGSETDYVIELADNDRFDKPIIYRACILETSDIGYYFPKREELPKKAGIWYARVKTMEGEWSESLIFKINLDHARMPVRRKITRENPYFTIFDYSEHDPADMWNIIPENLKPYIGLGLIASYKAPSDQIVPYLLKEDMKGYQWHLGAAGPHDTQFNKYCITGLAEIEYVLQNCRNLISVGFVEQYLGTKPDDYWRNEYFFRLLILCAKYGVTFIYSDGNRNYLELASMIKRPLFMNYMREYAEYFIFSYKQNHSNASYTCFGAVLGAWMDKACIQIGVQPENWYWNDAGFRDKPGECFGYLQGNEQQIPACMSVEMLLTGLSIGAANYSMEGESWLIEMVGTDKMQWSEHGLAALSFLQAIVEHQLIPDKDEVTNKIKAAVDYDGWGMEILGDAHEGGIFRNLFDEIYEIRNGYELFPKNSRYFYLPLVTDNIKSFEDKMIIHAEEIHSREQAAELLAPLYPQKYQGDAYLVETEKLVIIMNSNENTNCPQSYKLIWKDGLFNEISGCVGLWQYLIIKKNENNLLLHMNAPVNTELKVTIKCKEQPQVICAEKGIFTKWNKNSNLLTLVAPGRDVPFEVSLGKKGCAIEKPLKAVANKEELEEEYLSDMPFYRVEVKGNTLPTRNQCANQKFGKLPLLVDHLRYKRGFSIAKGTEMEFHLDKRYRELEFQYGFDIDAWMPKIIDKDHIIWDRSEKSISMELQVWGDGKLIFQSPLLKNTAGTFLAKVNVKDLEYIKIKLIGELISEDPEAQVYMDICNPVLRR